MDQSNSGAEGNDYIAIRSMMFLGLSHDHRLIDGLYAVQFTERVKQYMESYRVEGICALPLLQKEEAG